MHDNDPRTRDEINQDLAEMLGGEPPAPRMNGPALMLLCDGRTPQPATGMLLILPMRNYDGLILRADWKLDDPHHRAILELVQTLDEFPGDEGTAWTPLREQYDPRKSTWVHNPSARCAENAMRLRYRDLHATAVGMRLRTSPEKAPLRARIWCLLLGRSTDGREGVDPDGTIRVGDDEYRLPPDVAATLKSVKVEGGRIWGKVHGSDVWGDVTSWCMVRAKPNDPLADDCPTCFGEGTDGDGKPCGKCGGTGKRKEGGR